MQLIEWSDMQYGQVLYEFLMYFAKNVLCKMRETSIKCQAVLNGNPFKKEFITWHNNLISLLYFLYCVILSSLSFALSLYFFVIGRFICSCCLLFRNVLEVISFITSKRCAKTQIAYRTVRVGHFGFLKQLFCFQYFEIVQGNKDNKVQYSFLEQSAIRLGTVFKLCLCLYMVE